MANDIMNNINKNAVDVYSGFYNKVMTKKVIPINNINDHDEVNDKVFELGLRPANAMEMYRAKLGYLRRKFLDDNNIESNASILTLGWMPSLKFFNYVYNRIGGKVFKYGKVDSYEEWLPENAVSVIAIEFKWYFVDDKAILFSAFAEVSDYIHSTKNKDVRNLHKYGLLHYLKRKHNIKILPDDEYFKFVTINRFDGYELSPTTSVGLKYKYDGVYKEAFMDFLKAIGKQSPRHVWNTFSSNANLSYIPSRNKVVATYDNKERSEIINVHRLGNYNIIKVKGLYIMWKNNNIMQHVENESKEKVLEFITKRKRMDSLNLCLNDVRNDKPNTAAFCLSGTKRFLADRMPFLYNLIKDYNSWDEIPDDIMSEVYHLEDESIFDGYPRP